MENDLKKLKFFLETYQYNFYYYNISGAFNYYFNPFQNEEIVRKKLEQYPEEIQVLFSFLLLGEAVQKNQKYPNINEILLITEKLGVSINDGDKYKMNNLCLIAYNNYFFFVDIPYYYSNSNSKDTNVYIGMDTYRLTNILPKIKNKQILDLCSGSGIQGIVCSSTNKVTFVEYNSNTIPILQLNLILNDIESGEIICSDLFENVSENYDLIVSNPPFIPVPSDLDYPLAGNGGEDGLLILDRIISGLDSHLRNNGSCILIGECLGNTHTNTLLEKTVRNRLSKGYTVNLFLNSEEPALIYADKLAQLYKRIKSCNYSHEKLKSMWNSICDKFNANAYYSFTLFIQKKEKNDLSDFRIINNFSMWNDCVIPSIKPNITISPVEGEDLYQIIAQNRKVTYIDKAIYEIINRVNGVSNFWDILPLKNLDAKMYQYILNSFEQFYSLGLIEKKVVNNGKQQL